MIFFKFFFTFSVSHLKCTCDKNYIALIFLSWTACTIGACQILFCPTVCKAPVCLLVLKPVKQRKMCESQSITAISIQKIHGFTTSESPQSPG